MNDENLKSLVQLCRQLPQPLLNSVIQISEDSKDLPYEKFLRRIQQEFGNANIYQTLFELKQKDNNIQTQELLTALQTAQLFRLDETEATSLVWTGPTSNLIPMRKTEQVMLELIRDAVESIFIASFAFYRITDLLETLEEAADRGVNISLLLETPQSSHYKILHDPLQHIPASLREKVKIYIWPYEKRKQVSTGEETGSLHAKFLIQDKKALLVSSANLTKSAFERNIELGVVVRDKAVVSLFQRHLDELIINNQIVKI